MLRCGTTIGGRHDEDVWPGTICIEETSSDAVWSWMSAGQVRCDTLRVDRAERQARSTELVRVLGPQDHMIVRRDVLEQCEDVDLLLEEGADLVVVGMAGDGQHGGMVQLGVVKPVQEMDGAGTARREANTQPPRELGVAAGGEGRRLLVPALDEADLFLVLAQRLEDPVDPVSRESERRVHSPGEQLLDDDVPGCLGHHPFLVW